MYFAYHGKPYYLAADGKVYPVTISAQAVCVGFNTPFKRSPTTHIESLMTEDEIRSFLGLHLVEVYDPSTGKTTFVSNETISTVPVRRKSPRKKVKEEKDG